MPFPSGVRAMATTGAFSAVVMAGVIVGASPKATTPPPG